MVCLLIVMRQTVIVHFQDGLDSFSLLVGRKAREIGGKVGLTSVGTVRNYLVGPVKDFIKVHCRMSNPTTAENSNIVERFKKIFKTKCELVK